MDKQLEPETRPHVTIALKPHLEAYLRYVSKTPEKEKAITIDRRLDAGQLIHSLVLISEYPVKCTFKENPVMLILPQVHETPLQGNHFFKISDWGELKINDWLEYEFKMWVYRRFEIGYRKNYTQNQITEAILRGLNLRNQVINFETIKKNDYRNRRGTEEKRFISLLTDCE
jgi:hypothetical protein